MSVVRMRREISDLDEAVEVFQQAFTGGGLRVAEPDDEFRYVQDVVAADGVAAVYQSLNVNVAARSDESDTLRIAWTDSGSTSYRMGSTELDADAGILWSGRKPIEASVVHAEIPTITLDRADFETRARRLLARPDFVLPDFVPLVSPAHIALARQHFAALRNYHLDESIVGNPLAWRAACDLTVAIVLAATGLDRVRVENPKFPLTVRRAMAYIDDNLDQPIALADIAAAAGLSARGLQLAFQRYLGETPMARLRRWGFAHHGRFAQLYARAFGESPSATLRS